MIVKHVVASIAAVLMTVTSCSTTGNEATAEGSADTWEDPITRSRLFESF